MRGRGSDYDCRELRDAEADRRSVCEGQEERCDGDDRGWVTLELDADEPITDGGDDLRRRGQRDERDAGPALPDAHALVLIGALPILRVARLGARRGTMRAVTRCLDIPLCGWRSAVEGAGMQRVRLNREDGEPEQHQGCEGALNSGSTHGRSTNLSREPGRDQRGRWNEPHVGWVGTGGRDDELPSSTGPLQFPRLGNVRLHTETRTAWPRRAQTDLTAR